jgi:hypothetical protein
MVLHMKTFSQLCQYLAQFVLKWKIFWIRAVEKVKIHILCSVAFYEVISRSIVTPDRPQTAIWRRVGCWIRKATRAESRFSARTPTHPHTSPHTHTHTNKHVRANTHNSPMRPTHTQKYVIFIAFPHLQWFCETASLLRYTYIACLV